MECPTPLQLGHFPSFPRAEIEESVAELGGHNVVEDGIECGVGVEHDPAKVQ